MNRSAFALAAMIVLGAAQAHADTMVVPAHNLKIVKSADVQLLTQRIQVAAMDLCGAPLGSSKAMAEDVRHSSCYHSLGSVRNASEWAAKGPRLRSPLRLTG